jgi:hypothetical protein
MLSRVLCSYFPRSDRQSRPIVLVGVLSDLQQQVSLMLARICERQGLDRSPAIFGFFFSAFPSTPECHIIVRLTARRGRSMQEAVSHRTAILARSNWKHCIGCRLRLTPRKRISGYTPCTCMMHVVLCKTKFGIRRCSTVPTMVQAFQKSNASLDDSKQDRRQAAARPRSHMQRDQGLAHTLGSRVSVASVASEPTAILERSAILSHKHGMIPYSTVQLNFRNSHSAHCCSSARSAANSVLPSGVVDGRYRDHGY